MRPSLLIAAVLLLPLAPLAPADAQAAHLLTDEKGDTVLGSGVGPSVPISGNAAADGADLLSLDLMEEEDAFTFVLAVASMSDQSGGEYAIEFSWRDVDYAIFAFRSNPTFGDFQQATLYASDGSGFERVATLPMTVDASKATATIGVQKVFVLDGAKRAPGRGDAIRNVHVTAEQTTFGSFSFTGGPGAASVVDYMPNEGDGPNYGFHLGDIMVGHLSITTPDRIRVSNGGATTFVFQASVRNNASYEDEVDLKLADLPDGWNGTVQSPLRIPAGSERSVAMLVSVPFAHQHGGYSSFNLTTVSKKDAGSHASMRFGVLHTPIPQPAGHHSEMYLHGQNANGGLFATTFPFGVGYFNTESKHDDDIDVQPNGFGGSGGGKTWTLPLNPGLRIGIDMDLNRTGTLEGSVLSHQTGTGSLSARLYLVRERGAANQSERAGNDQGILLAEAKAIKVTFDLQQPTPFKMSVVPLPDADYIPSQRGQNLVLVLRMTEDQPSPCCITGANAPALVSKDFKMVLPLNEYNDQISGTPDVASGLDIRAEGPLEKAGRPGSIMTYQFTLVNGAPAETVVELDVAGNEAKYGTLVPQGRTTLGPHESRRVTLAVHIPGDAAVGKDLEVLVFAHAQDDPSKMAIARTKTTVTTGANATDDETSVLLAAREAEHKSPGPGAALLLVGAAAAVAMLGRRKR